jgi:hypothetical protein
MVRQTTFALGSSVGILWRFLLRLLIRFYNIHYSLCIILFRKYGARKTWHLLGSVLVALSFPFIFLPCLGCRFVVPFGEEEQDVPSLFSCFNLFYDAAT